MRLSIIIPTYNERNNISTLLKSISKGLFIKSTEIIIVDAPDSTDNIQEVINIENSQVIKSKKGGRASQMNAGASIAKGEVLYFVHADTILPVNYDSQIKDAITKGFQMGCFRFKFDSNNILLAINSFFTRLPFLWCRGGDQTLFIKKDVFDALGAYDEEYTIMEEYDFIKRALQKQYKFKVMNADVIVSSRKYHKNGYFKVQLSNFKAMWMFNSGRYSPQQIKNVYQNSLDTKY